MSVLPFKEDEDFRKHNQHAEESAPRNSETSSQSTSHSMRRSATCGATRRIC
jgi:hypothetical protein